MQKIFFSLVLLALCASQTSTPALAQAPAAESPARQEAPAQPEKQQPENMPPQTVTSQAPQADQQQDPASTGTGSTGTGSTGSAEGQATSGPQQNSPTATEPAAASAKRTLPPLRELITSPFGNRRMPGWLSRRGLTMRDHAGIDIRARMGWPITAFKPGTVIRAGENGALGISVDIKQDDGMTARYGHMSKTVAKSGQRVEAGEPVGLVGCTGRTTGAHLHFGLLDASGKSVDPMPFLHSADEVLRPAPEDIPPVLEAQSCGPVQRGPNGRPVHLGEMLKKMDSYTPPPIPKWNERP
ncbi:M23 family metallopeptidase [Desulfovibrio sp.]|uniref:M23 family metallopeptidase n=1 Tax=Desulfovibrio sp. TaxID=885 RepID=UPI0035AF3A9A